MSLYLIRAYPTIEDAPVPLSYQRVHVFAETAEDAGTIYQAASVAIDLPLVEFSVELVTREAFQRRIGKQLEVALAHRLSGMACYDERIGWQIFPAGGFPAVELAGLVLQPG